MFTKLRELVLDSWESWNLGPKSSDISFIRRGSTWLGDAGKVVYIIFRRGDRFPSLIAKTVTSYEYGKTILNEAQNIMTVWNSASVKLRENLPRPLDVIEVDGIPVYFEEATPGVAFPEKVMFCRGRKKKEKIISETMDKLAVWLSDFQRCFSSDKELMDSGIVDEQILKPLEYFSIKHDLSAREQRFIAELREIAGSLADRNIPLQPAHGDLWGGSLLWGLDERLHIIDWEYFKAQGLPLQDILCLAIHPGFVTPSKGGDGMQGEFMNLFEESYFAEAVRYVVWEQAQAAGVDSVESIQIFLALALISLSTERDQKASVNTRDSWRALFRYLVNERDKCKLL